MLDTEGFRVHLHLATANRNSVCNQVTMRVQRKGKVGYTLVWERGGKCLLVPICSYGPG